MQRVSTEYILFTLTLKIILEELSKSLWELCFLTEKQVQISGSVNDQDKKSSLDMFTDSKHNMLSDSECTQLASILNILKHECPTAYF